MIINEELFGTMLEGCADWALGPEQLLVFVTLVTHLSAANAAHWGQGPIDSTMFSKELAGIMIREFSIDISPYRDLDEVWVCCASKGGILKKFVDIMERIKQDDALFELSETTGVMLSEETMAKAIVHDLLGREVIKRLRPYITFV